jgi:sugar/nucleoside kinase (ribokinase family)
VKVVDTLGAGDFLHGAFCSYYLQLNLNFENALNQAANLATFTCKFEGTRNWINFTK